MNHYVYKITCTHPDHFSEYYIGKRSCSCDIYSDKYMGSGTRITRLIKKYGIDFFHKEILCTAHSQEEAYLVEKTLVTEDIINDSLCLNLITGGHGGTQSEETRKRVSKTMIKLWEDPKRRLYYSDMVKNRSPDIVDKISKGLSGIPKSETHKKALSHALKGKPKSEEHKRKLSEVNKGKTMSVESIEKLKLTNQSESVREQRSHSAKNRPKVECPYCQRLVDSSTAKRWHFDNCKFNKGA